MNSYIQVTIGRDDLEKVLAVFKEDNKEFVHMGIELDSINGDQILWVDNGKSGDNRAHIRINQPYKGK